MINFMTQFFITSFSVQQFFSAFLALFAIIDVIGAIPPILANRHKKRIVNHKRVTLYCGIILFCFFYIGEAFLTLFHLDIPSFAVAGSLVVFCIGLEMILDVEIFHSSVPGTSEDASFIPTAFPLLAGAGVLTTLLSIRSQYNDINILLAILANLLIIYYIVKWADKIEKVLGRSTIYMMQKLFGIILLAIAVKLFISNVTILVHTIVD